MRLRHRIHMRVLVVAIALLGCSRDDHSSPPPLTDGGGCVGTGCVVGGTGAPTAGAAGAGGGAQARAGAGGSGGVTGVSATVNLARISDVTYQLGTPYVGTVTVSATTANGGTSDPIVVTTSSTMIDNVATGLAWFRARPDPTVSQAALGSIVRTTFTAGSSTTAAVTLPLVDPAVIATTFGLLPQAQQYDPALPRAHIVAFVTDAKGAPLSGVTATGDFKATVAYDEANAFTGVKTGARGLVLFLGIDPLGASHTITFGFGNPQQRVQIPVVLESGLVTFFTLSLGA